MTKPPYLSDEERKAIAALKRIGKKWPSTLWLFSASGMLHVMRCGENGEQIMTAEGGVDIDYPPRIDTIHGIHNDGGDW